ncbi:hypothetical protein VTN02DRAFT_390 [Thermoascus thermophilus]
MYPVLCTFYACDSKENQLMPWLTRRVTAGRTTDDHVSDPRTRGPDGGIFRIRLGSV